jgi:hypothetical protein
MFWIWVFFAALQALFEKSSPSNIQEIESNVIKAYLEYPVDKSNRVFLTLQGCMIEIMRAKGGQHYAIPHMKKHRRSHLYGEVGRPPYLPSSEHHS